jgi:phosphoglycolate phosphatase-like HAD superfamily hydrolase
VRYIECGDAGGPAYVRGGSFGDLSRVDVVVFDCDGVLLDVRRSYIRAVAWTVGALVEAFTGTVVPEALLDPELSHAYKRTGGFNNDWCLAYALAMRIMAEIPSDATREVNRVADESTRFIDLRERLYYIRGNRPNARILLDGLRGRLMGFAGELDMTGCEAVDRLLCGSLEPVRRALAWRGGVGECLVSTMFEEALLGRRLFEEQYGEPARFTDADEGFVEGGRVVVTEATFRGLSSVLGGPRLGVASGSMRGTALHLLGGLMDHVPREAQVWHGDVDEAAKKTGDAGLHKPGPYSLLRACEPYRPFSRALYVGDTAADRAMARRAGEGFMFAGVYGLTHSPESSMREFLESGCDVVAPTVNELPGILSMVRGGL